MEANQDNEPGTKTSLASRPTTTDSPPRFHLVIYNISKRANVSALMKTAVAFGCRSILLVGQPKNANEEKHHPLVPKPVADVLQEVDDQSNDTNTASLLKGNREITSTVENNNPVQLLRFPKWRDCLEWLTANNVYLVGVEIDEESLVLNDDLDLSELKADDFAILMGNEGQGIHPKHLAACQSTIRIPQYGSGTASFNVNVAASIVLHHLHSWKRRRRGNERRY